MLATDEDALICDFAETYHVLNWRGLPLHLAATLAVGLRPNSRIKSAMVGYKAPFDTVLLAAAVDRLGGIAWMMSEDGRRGVNRPEALVPAMTGQKKESEVISFASSDAFEAARKRLLGEVE